ncbi:hypothetical protein JYU34_017047 [Plutella xylostella]|uniref:Uncharacterized protein n=1 Tax=Plutella xylostella TaxID=51655 RepID=A0ABQ7Q434_PLUXY|nr:hypothetical protein JYU34_017047 [Plutella xylostella]
MCSASGRTHTTVTCRSVRSSNHRSSNNRSSNNNRSNSNCSSNHRSSAPGSLCRRDVWTRQPSRKENQQFL